MIEPRFGYGEGHPMQQQRSRISFHFITKLGFLILLVLGFLTASPLAEAKDLTGRLGLGYNSQFSQSATTNGVPGISVKYGIAPRAMIEVVGGFYSGASGTGVAALKYMRTIYPETYANFYFLVGAGLVAATQRSGTEFLGGFGCEFFIPGLDSIGITFETGLSAENVTAVSKTYVLKTFGVSFINAGMHFYF